MGVLLYSSGFLSAKTISDVAGTSHNFSTSGSGTVTATTESQICVFCHTPHHATDIPNAPLWNRQAFGGSYTPYKSASIDANDIAATPGGSSKLCLSCHDGTIAIGSVNVVNSQTDVTIELTGTSAGGKIPFGAGDTTGFTRKLDTNLSNDHPISFTYDSTLSLLDGELRNPDIETHIANRIAGSKPLVPLEKNKVQCTSCHDPHIRDFDDVTKNIKFLRLNRFQEFIPQGGGFSQADDILCLACHDKLGQAWSTSAHADSAVADEIYSPTASSQREFPDNLPVWKASCLNCHDTHTVIGAERLLREGTDSLSSPKTGGNAAQEEACYTCHSNDGGVLVGQGGAAFEVPDIKTDFFFGLTHMPITTDDQPAATETHDITNADLIEDKTKFNNSNRHVECTDCHNPHRVTKNRLFNNAGSTVAGTHLHAAGHTNIASGVLKGSWGVEPSYGSANFDPNVLPLLYTIKSGDGGTGANIAVNNAHVTREYQICLKCHSDYAFGSNPPMLGDSGGNTSSGTNGMIQYTNQAMEFQAPVTHRGQVTTTDSGASAAYSSNNHRSWHPVMGPTGRTTSIRDARANNWLSPWNNTADIGNQTMYCSDCHGSDTASGTVVPSGGENGKPWGPHGSSNNFILKGNWDASTGTNNSNDLCFKCHSYTLYATEGDGASGFGGDGDDNLHSVHAKRIDRVRCSWCHVAVPHGWKNKAFLVNLNDVGPEAGLPPGTQVRNNTKTPYTNPPYYNNAVLKIRSFATSGNWIESDCGSAGSPGNGESGTNWMDDGNEACGNLP
ncbi:MAG: hypothetical protein IIB69_01535 [Proteobacteria bacterium]|nr:hypothetical protein [Pseudomonadota bacterium]